MLQFNAKIEKEFIIVSHGKKYFRVKRDSDEGITLESLLNNQKNGVHEAVLQFYVHWIKKPVPPLPDSTDQQAYLTKISKEFFSDLGKRTSKGLEEFTNNHIRIEVTDDGCQLSVPAPFKETFGIFMHIFCWGKKTGGKKATPENIKKLNEMFQYFHKDIKFKIEYNDKIGITGKDAMDFVEFIKAISKVA